MKNWIGLILLFCTTVTICQKPEYPSDHLTSEFHKQRREDLRSKMPKNSVAVFFANPVRNRANDVDYLYHQDPNFFYLTGYNETGSILLIFKEKQKSKSMGDFNEIIFSQSNINRRPLFDGELIGVEGVKALGFDQVHDADEFKKVKIDFSSFDKVLFFDFYDDVRDDPKSDADLYSLIEQFKEKISLPSQKDISLEKQKPFNGDTKTLVTLMAELREIKTEAEISLLRKAIDISCIGQREVMKAMHPKMSEAEVQGIHEFVFKKYGAEYEGYPSIVGAGHNGCTLHYIKNDKMEIKNDLVLMDLGAEYHGYTADVTRTVPANGKFSEEEKAIYNIVLAAQEAAFLSLKPGNTFSTASPICKKVINQGLFELGILNSIDQKNDYLPHGVTHHIGLDVHDPGIYKTYAENMVITIEPGIYIPNGSPCDPKWWGIAVRIEDDLLITKDGYELLSDKAPRTVEEIEALMKEDNIFSGYSLPDLGKE